MKETDVRPPSTPAQSSWLSQDRITAGPVHSWLREKKGNTGGSDDGVKKIKSHFITKDAFSKSKGVAVCRDEGLLPLGMGVSGASVCHL